jgi:hypothetical protein
MVAAAYTVPNLPGLNATPLPTPTLQPTETPLPAPSPTPITYESLIPAGWKQFASVAAPGMEIWLPPSYVPQTEKDRKNAIQVPGVDDGEQIVSVLLLKDTAPSPYLLLTTFEIITRPVLDTNLDLIVEDQFSVLMRAGQLLENAPFAFETETYPARRLVWNINVSGVDGGLAIYVVQVDGNLYFLGFATPFNELYTRLPVFDQIAQTFRVLTP